MRNLKVHILCFQFAAIASSELLPLLLTSSIAMLGEVISEAEVLATLNVESL